MGCCKRGMDGFVMHDIGRLAPIIGTRGCWKNWIDYVAGSDAG